MFTPEVEGDGDGADAVDARAAVRRWSRPGTRVAEGAWTGGSFGDAARVRARARTPTSMTLDGTNTWVLREPGAGRSVVVDPGPSIAGPPRRGRRRGR